MLDQSGNGCIKIVAATLRICLYRPSTIESWDVVAAAVRCATLRQVDEAILLNLVSTRQAGLEAAKRQRGMV